MSVIQVDDLVSYQLRTNYLNTVKDGVGERLITINDGFLNTSGFKTAGWRSNPEYIKRVHSPPIPTAVTSEYFQAPRATGAGIGLEDEAEEGGMITGGGISGDTVGPGAATKRRRRREQMEEEDSSDLSDDSDDDGDQRAAQQIKFAKMPVRTRSGSSPARSSNTRDMTSPNRTANVRRGSQSALEAVKARARRDTVTSSEFSSENELENSAVRRAQAFNRGAVKATRVLAKHTSDPNLVIKRQQSDLLEEEEDESDGSDASSEAFPESIDSASILESIGGTMTSSPLGHAIGGMPRQLSRALPKKPKPPPPALEALPPPRPISMIQPKSLLSAAINAKKTKAAMPFESFASLSGKGDPNPLRIRIWVPFTKSSDTYYEVLMRRTIHESEAGDRQVTVADLIGLSLWRYQEENLEPHLPTEKLNVNKWVLRLIDDDEVDYDFPALERTKTVVSFTTVNNARGRVRAGAKNFDEFGLVEATDEQFQQNQKATPHFKQEAVVGEAGDDDLTPKNTPLLKPATIVPMGPKYNPVLVTRSGLRQNSTLADMPNTPMAQSATRNGMPKLIRVTINTIDATPGQLVTVDVTTDTYLAEVLDIVCKKRQLDKANHVLKIPTSGTVVLLDRTVDSIGNIQELELVRRRFATDGPLTITGSPIPSQAGMSPRIPMLGEGPLRRAKKTAIMGTHPLKETIKQDEFGGGNYKRFTVWRKKPMSFVSMNERVIAIDGEYLHIMPANAGKTMFEGPGKTTTVHFSNVVGCKQARRHPTTFKVLVYKNTVTKRYDFESKTPAEALEIVTGIKRGCSPYHDD